MGSCSDVNFVLQYAIIDGPCTRAIKGVGLLPLAYSDCGFDSNRKHGCQSVVSVVCCQVEVSTEIVSSNPTGGMDVCLL